MGDKNPKKGKKKKQEKVAPVFAPVLQFEPKLKNGQKQAAKGSGNT